MNILYCRKSTESEDRQVLSIESQRHELELMAARDGATIDKTFTESMSAKNTERPEFQKLIALIKKNPGCILYSWKLDRLSRNPEDSGKIQWLLQQGIIQEIRTFERTYHTNDNVLLMSVELGMANQYLRDLSVNVRRGIRAKLDIGGWIGRAPIGYLNDKANHTVYPDPITAPYVKRIFEMFGSGNHSPSQIADILYADGFRTNRAAKKVHKSTIYRILNSPFYAGTIVYKGKLFPATHTPLVSQTLFDQCASVFSPNRIRQHSNLFPLRGCMRCAECGCSLTASTKRGHVYYYCTNGRGSCAQHKLYLRGAAAAELVASVFQKIKIETEMIEFMYQAAKEQTATEVNYHETARQNILVQQHALAGKKIRLEEVYLDGSMDKERYSARILELNNEEIALANQLKQLNHEQGYSTLEQTKKAFLTAFTAEKDFLSASDEDRAGIVKNLLWNITVLDNNLQSYQLKQPFQLMADVPKNTDILVWRRGVEAVRQWIHINQDTYWVAELEPVQ